VQWRGRAQYDYRRIGIPLTAVGMITFALGVVIWFFTQSRPEAPATLAFLFLALLVGTIQILTYCFERIEFVGEEVIWISRTNREKVRIRLDDLVAVVEDDSGEGRRAKIVSGQGTIKISDALDGYDELLTEIRRLLEERRAPD
jgi:hypothetical protein